MSNLQLFIAIALPVIAILLTWVDTRATLRDFGTKLDGLQKESAETRLALANLRAELYEKFTLKVG